MGYLLSRRVSGQEKEMGISMFFPGFLFYVIDIMIYFKKASLKDIPFILYLFEIMHFSRKTPDAEIYFTPSESGKSIAGTPFFMENYVYSCR